jgi:hypothetical protein
MVTDTQAAYIMALLKERHSAVKRTFDALLNAYATGDQNQVVAANEQLRGALGQLRAVIAAEHLPDWFKDLNTNAERYANGHANGLPIWRAHLDSALRNASLLNAETWTFSEQEEVLFDIDAIVDKARQDHNIVALYERVIQSLDALLRSGEIDSIKAVTDLERLIATLRQAKSGTFSSQIFSWQFARRLVPNIISAYVKRSNITGPLIDAIEQTASELDISLGAAKDQIGDGILAAAANALRTGTSASITHEAILFLESPNPDEEASIETEVEGIIDAHA